MNCRDATGLEGEEPLTASAQQLARDLSAGKERCRKTPTSQDCQMAFHQWLIARFGDAPGSARRLGRQGAFSGAVSAGYINGITTPPDAAEATARGWAKLLHTQVDPLHNPSQGRVADLWQTFIVHKAFGGLDESTRLVVEYMRLELRMLEPGEYKLMIAHSQGGAILTSALEYLTPAERARIDVLAVGDATTSFPPGIHSIRPVANVADLVTMLMGSGSVGDRKDVDVDYVLFLANSPQTVIDFIFGPHYVDDYIRYLSDAPTRAAAASERAEEADIERRRLTVKRMNRK